MLHLLKPKSTAGEESHSIGDPTLIDNEITESDNDRKEEEADDLESANSSEYEEEESYSRRPLYRMIILNEPS